MILNTYLRLRSLYNRAMNYLFDVSEVKVYKDQEIQNYTARFYIIRTLRKFGSYSDSVINMIDVNGDKVHIHLKKVTGNKNIIVETDDLTLDQIVSELEKRSVSSDTVESKIVVTFSIDSKCIKNITKNYKEVEPVNQHTLENILLFNDIPHSSESKLKLVYFEKGKMITIEVDLMDVKDLHINDVLHMSESKKN